MHNIFINELMDWRPTYKELWVRAANKVLQRSGSLTRVKPVHGTGSMTNVEQRMNLFHLLRQVLVYGVPGEVVDVGVLTGQTAGLFGRVLREYAPERKVHGYNLFAGGPAQINQVLANFASVGAEPPVLHRGRVEDTLPSQLPKNVCFASVDLGSPDNGDIAGSVRHCLEALYPVLSTGAVCVLQDYCDKQLYDGWDPWPAVKKGADAFFVDKPESVSVLYAGYYSHGFFRKR